MKLTAKLTPLDLKKGSFENQDKETIEYFQVQVEMQKEVKVGDELRTQTEYPLLSCTKEVYENLEVGIEANFEVAVTYDFKNKALKYRLVDIA